MRLETQQVQILFVHLQPHLVVHSATEKPERIERSVKALMDAAAAFAIPVTFALVPSDGSAPIDPLVPFVDDRNCFVAELAAPFLLDRLRHRLDGHGRPILVVCGFATEVAVLHTVGDAIAAGYRVLVPVDTVGSQSIRAEQAALQHIDRMGGEVMSTATLLSLFAPDFRDEPGSAIVKLIRTLNA